MVIQFLNKELSDSWILIILGHYVVFFITVVRNYPFKWRLGHILDVFLSA